MSVTALDLGDCVGMCRFYGLVGVHALIWVSIYSSLQPLNVSNQGANPAFNRSVGQLVNIFFSWPHLSDFLSAYPSV